MINIKSKNPNLLSLLNKNPNSDFGVYTKTYKNGNLFGVVESDNEYNVIFIDTFKYIYAEYSDNLIDFQSYCNPQAALNFISELFPQFLVDKHTYYSQTISWLNKTNLELDKEEATIEIPLFYIDSNWYRDGKYILSRYIPNLDVNQIKGNLYSLKYTGKNIFETFNVVSLVCLMTTITNEQSFVVEEQLVNKYVKVLTNIDNLPYFMFYLFIKRAIFTQTIFEKVKTRLENYFVDTPNPVLKFHFEDTHGCRLNSISEKIGLDRDIIDIGCGELKYVRKFLCNLGFNKKYYAFDLDEKTEERINLFKTRYKHKVLNSSNLIHLKNISDLYNSDEVYNIIITEVIEHNEIDVSKKLILDIVTNINFEKLVITTPDADFNQFYFIGEDLNTAKRREDHVFELSQNDFREYINDIFKDTTYKIDFIQIGDQLLSNNKIVTPTQGVVITK